MRKKEDKNKNNVGPKTNNIRFKENEEINDIITISSKNNNSKTRPNKFNNFPIFSKIKKSMIIKKFIKFSPSLVTINH